MKSKVLLHVHSRHCLALNQDSLSQLLTQYWHHNYLFSNSEWANCSNTKYFPSFVMIPLVAIVRSLLDCQLKGLMQSKHLGTILSLFFILLLQIEAEYKIYTFLLFPIKMCFITSLNKWILYTSYCYTLKHSPNVGWYKLNFQPQNKMKEKLFYNSCHFKCSAWGYSSVVEQQIGTLLELISRTTNK